MSKNISALVNLTVNDGVKDVISKIKTFLSGTIEVYTTGQLNLASAAGEQTLNMGGVANVLFFYMICTDASTGIAKSVSIDVNDVAGTGQVSLYGEMAEIMWTSPENADIGSIFVTPQSDGTGTLVEYIIGGTK